MSTGKIRQENSLHRSESPSRSSSQIEIECDFGALGEAAGILHREWSSALQNCLVSDRNVRSVVGCVTVLEATDLDGEAHLVVEFRGQINGISVEKKGHGFEKSMASLLSADIALILLRPLLKLNKSRLRRVACACVTDLFLELLDAAGIRRAPQSLAFVRFQWVRRIAMLLGFVVSIVIVMTTKIAPHGFAPIERCYIGAVYGLFAIISIYGLSTLVIALTFRPQFFKQDLNGIAELAFQNVKTVAFLCVRAVILLAVGICGMVLLIVCS